MHILDWLTSAPLWLQAPLVVGTAAALCAAIAFGFLRLIDVADGKLTRWLKGKNEK
ncbi:hypothetical protein [Corynebacterium epidermidicanis]|uniref:Uncharacterized protein n=1 Tax=Corynebacterium epidermidicanis TaxID=1050174 RepID=A0A0G3GXV5_9CORY|nr:hypothetical protein [Corynebacterium epidermidicanis]AKK03642.1 hypothetical protein CEPID_08980 [Corynebacterium epidermidicanis]